MNTHTYAWVSSLCDIRFFRLCLSNGCSEFAWCLICRLLWGACFSDVYMCVCVYMLSLCLYLLARPAFLCVRLSSILCDCVCLCVFVYCGSEGALPRGAPCEHRSYVSHVCAHLPHDPVVLGAFCCPCWSRWKAVP